MIRTDWSQTENREKMRVAAGWAVSPLDPMTSETPYQPDRARHLQPGGLETPLG